MTLADLEAYVARLVHDAHDQDALLAAYNACTDQPDQYALFLEAVGAQARDPMMAAHWLYEAAGVWEQSVGDTQRSAELLISALETDPTNPNVGAKLAEMYRSVGDSEGLLHMQAVRAAALKPLAESGALSGDAALHADYTSLLSELTAHYAKADVLDLSRTAEYMHDAHVASPEEARLLPPLREVLKQLGRVDETLPLYAQEIALTSDIAARTRLVADYMEALELAGDMVGLTTALSTELQLDPNNLAFQQRYAGTVHARFRAGTPVMPDEAEYAVACLLAGLPSRDANDALGDTEMALDLAPHDTAAMEAYVRACSALGLAPTRSRQSIPAAAPISLSPTAIESSMNVEGVALDFPTTASAYQAPAYVPPASTASGRSIDSSASLRAAPSKPLSAPPSAANLPASASPSAGNLKASHSEAERQLHSGDRAGALATYQRILESSPADAESLSWVEDHLRSSRQYAQLRDVLLGALRADTQAPIELRKTRWRDIAGICESHLRDPEGAIGAWKQLLQLDPNDDNARNVLTRQLERLQRWDELASLLERQALSETDTESRLAMEKRLARVHEDKRQDFLGAADAWARAARLSRGDEGSVERAVTLYERAARHDLALSVLREQLDGVTGAERDAWVAQLADLHEHAEEWRDSTELRLELAERQASIQAWENCERVADLASDFVLAARAARTRAELSEAGVERSLWLARSASHLAKGGDQAEATLVLKLAGEADLHNHEVASLYDARLDAVGDHAGRVAFLEKRAGAQTDAPARAKILLQAASLTEHALHDDARTKQFYQQALRAQPSREAYFWLADHSAKSGDHAEEARLLGLALPTVTSPSDSLALSLRLAATLSESLGRHGDAAKLLEARVDESAASAPVLAQLTRVYERDNKLPEALATATKQLPLAQGADRASVATDMARLAKATRSVGPQIVALEVLHQLQRLDNEGLLELADAYRDDHREADELRTLALLEQQVLETDRPAIALRRASLLTPTGQYDEALQVLHSYAHNGHAEARRAWILAAESAGKSTDIAAAQFSWWGATEHSDERTTALEDALRRYLASKDDTAALEVARALLSSPNLRVATLSQAEALAASAHDNLSLERAQRSLVASMTGAERSTEFVRQAELRLASGWDVAECVSHAELGVSGAPAESHSLLERIALLLSDAKSRVEVFERQALRASSPSDKVEALARASHYALKQDQAAAAKSFLDTALSLAPTPDTCTTLELYAHEFDAGTSTHPNVNALVAALSDSGRGLRDAGSFRSEALRHAAQLTFETLGDAARAWSILGESLSASPTEHNLQTLRTVETKTEDHTSAVRVLDFALGGVFDATLSRALLLERARVKRDGLLDILGAAEDLRAAYDLAPGDAALWASLTEALRDANDFRGLVSAYEDRLLRERDPATRREFARSVARLWSNDLKDPREAADAWRRLLRLAPGDGEAQAGLELARNTVVGNPSVAPPASLRSKPAPPNLDALRVTPPAPPYEMLTSTDVLPDDPSSSIALLGPPLLTPDPSEVAVPLKTASLAPVALLSTADDSLVDEVELLELEEVETLDELDVVEG